MVLMGFFFIFKKKKIFAFVNVAIFDQVHDVEAIHDL